MRNTCALFYLVNCLAYPGDKINAFLHIVPGCVIGKILDEMKDIFFGSHLYTSIMRLAHVYYTRFPTLSSISSEYNVRMISRRLMLSICSQA